jgi:phosphoenolpyruvate carboxylase
MKAIFIFGGLVLIGVLCSLGIIFLGTREERKMKLIKKYFPNFEKDMEIYEDLWVTCIRQEDKIDILSKQVNQLTKELSYTCPCTRFYIQRENELKRLTAERKTQGKVYAELFNVLRQSRQNLEQKYFFIEFGADGGYDIVGSKREIKKGLKFCFKYEKSGK